jgi:tetratricopeptide (TPR) repeat protein
MQSNRSESMICFLIVFSVPPLNKTPVGRTTPTRPLLADIEISICFSKTDIDKSKELLCCPIVEKSLEMIPNDPYYLDTKGFILYNLGRYEDSVKCYDKSIEIWPENADAWYHKGLFFDKLGKIQEAEKCYNKAKELGLALNRV